MIPDVPPARKVGSPPTFTFRWAWLSATLALLSISAFGTLIVVVSVQGIDLLSTSALALAILAFSAQLVISLAQAISAGQQVASVERVNADAQAALSALRATSDALVSNQNTHFSEVLKAAIMPRGASSPMETSELAVSEVGHDDAPLSTLQLSPPGPEARIMSTYPSAEEGAKLAELFNSLTPWEAHFLTQLSTSALARVRRGAPLGVWLVDRDAKKGLGPGRRGLTEKKLIRSSDRVYEDGSTRTWMELTPLGVAMGGIMFGSGGDPEWLESAMGGRDVTGLGHD